MGLFATVFLVMGIFAIAGALGKWDLLLNSWQGKAFQKRLGLKRTQLLYIVFGVILVLLSGFLFYDSLSK
jgi:hypothetical protein